MTRPRRVFRSPGWYGLRFRRYWILRDVRRHPLRFSERNRIACRQHVRVGAWELWSKQ